MSAGTERGEGRTIRRLDGLNRDPLLAPVQVENGSMAKGDPA
jgi:hypothetical protein